MRRKTVALISIGQSPREDLLHDFTMMCGDAFRFLDMGALDELSLSDISRLAPQPGEADLITKLRTGQVIYVAHDRMTHYIGQALDKAAACGADWAVIACTGEFSYHQPPLRVLLPNQVLALSAAGFLRQGDAVTIIVPTPGQVGEATERWEKRGLSVARVIVATPFADYRSALETIQLDATIQATQALIADCFGFDIAFRERVAQVYDKPILLSRKLIGNLLLSVG